MIYQSPHIPKFSPAWRKRYLEHLRDSLAIAEGRMTAEEANAKWFAILKKEREEETRQMSLGVDRE